MKLIAPKAKAADAPIGDVVCSVTALEVLRKIDEAVGAAADRKGKKESKPPTITVEVSKIAYEGVALEKGTSLIVEVDMLGADRVPLRQTVGTLKAGAGKVGFSHKRYCKLFPNCIQWSAAWREKIIS